MSKPDWREPLAAVEVDVDIENEDAAEAATHVELRAVTGDDAQGKDGPAGVCRKSHLTASAACTFLTSVPPVKDTSLQCTSHRR